MNHLIFLEMHKNKIKKKEETFEITQEKRDVIMKAENSYSFVISLSNIWFFCSLVK